MWKAIVKCRTLEYLDTYTCIADRGIGIILKKENSNRLKLEGIDFEKLTFKEYYDNHKHYMNLIKNNEIFEIINAKKI